MSKTAMTSLVFFVLLVVFRIANCADPEAKMTITQVIRYHGYMAKEHSITTADDYILVIYRLTKATSKCSRVNQDDENGKDTKSKLPVFLMHGWDFDAGGWVANTPDKNLPYLLVDKGYDVWLGNVRGTRLSNKHKTLSPDKKEYWNFSLDEMVKYDIPSMVDYVLKKTGKSKIHYIGYSLGSTLGLALLASKPKYNNKFRSLHALGPVVHTKNTKSPVMKHVETYANTLQATGQYKFFYQTAYWKLISKTVCAVGGLQKICSNGLFLTYGFDNEQFNETRLPVFMRFYPSGTSTKAAQHVGQIHNHERLQMFDYGKKKNQEEYGSETPPLYDIRKIDADIALYSGENDWVATPDDVKYLNDNLKNVKLNYRVPFKKWNHIDFLWAKDVVKLNYNKLMDELESSSSN